MPILTVDVVEVISYTEVEVLTGVPMQVMEDREVIPHIAQDLMGFMGVGVTVAILLLNYRGRKQKRSK